MPAFLAYLGSYLVSRALEPSTWIGIGVVANAVAQHQGPAAIAQAAAGVGAALLPDPVKDAVKAALSVKK